MTEGENGSEPVDRPDHRDRKRGGSSPTFYTLEQLSRFDGRDGRRALVAYRGFVFDVSHSLLWSGGVHQGRHQAGRDLTEEFEAAPHGRLVLARVPIVGRLAPP